MGQDALAESVKRINIPEVSLRALLADYEEFLAAQAPESKKKLDERLGEPGFAEKMLEHAQAAMVASTLMMTLEPSVDFAELVKSAFPSAGGDAELLALRKELVSRALSMSKEVPSLANITVKLVRERQEQFLAEGA